MPFLILKYKKLKEDQNGPVIIISKKVSKKATVRNKLRRQIRAIIRQRVKEKNISKGIAVIVNPEILKKGFKEIKHEISRFIPD